MNSFHYYYIIINTNMENNLELKSIHKIKLNSDDIRHSEQIYNRIFKNIKKGNINPIGPLMDTPSNILVPLKTHQKRIVYEMLEKEKSNYRVSNALNAFVLADNVGSGKSMDILALIAHSPLVDHIIPNKLIYNVSNLFKGIELNPTIEFKTNLIVIPHGIYNQWIDYIVKYTSLTYYGVSTKKNIVNLSYDKLIEGTYNILLVKSTRYNDLMKDIYSKYNYSIITKCKYDMLNPNIKLFLKNIYKFKYIKEAEIEITSEFLDLFLNLKNSMNDIELEMLTELIDNNGKYPLSNILDYNGPLFQRVIIDEANSIQIPACKPSYGKVNWFVTSSVENLLYPIKNSWQYFYNSTTEGIKGSGFIKNIFMENTGKYYCNFIQDMYLKNVDQFVKESFELPEMNKHYIECFTPYNLRILENIAMPDVIQALNAGDIETALSSVGCKVSDQDNIVDIVLKDLNVKYSKKMEQISMKRDKLSLTIQNVNTTSNKINELKGVYEMLMENEGELQLIENTNQEIIENTNNLKKLNSKKLSTTKKLNQYNDDLKDLEFKIESIKNRISNIQYKDCPICGQIVSNPCITPCCNNIFCMSCLAQSFHYCKKNQCPLCRNQNITISSVTAIVDKVEIEETKAELPSKIDTLINVINDHPDGRFLVFSEFSNSFNEIIERFNESSIKYSILSGSTGRITNIIKDYTNNKIKVLLLNAKHYGSGLNLQMTTNIVIYHKMTPELENQVIGRGQRVGRTCSLQITHLCYKNEFVSK